jgi:hypothetical protein
MFAGTQQSRLKQSGQKPSVNTPNNSETFRSNNGSVGKLVKVVDGDGKMSLFVAPAQARAQNQDVFAEVSASVRERLAERLKLLIEYDRTQQWERMYDLLSDRFLQGETKEHLVNRRRYVAEKLSGDELIEFTPKSITSLHEESGWWLIRGCGEFRQSGSSRRVDTVVEAYLQNGEWYFSQIRMSTPIDSEPIPCSGQV